MSFNENEILERIGAALTTAITVARQYTPGETDVQYKQPHDPVTQADKAINEVLRQSLVFGDEGWLSEETTDGLARLQKRNVWVVDPLDGTREFVAGIREWAISIGFVVDGEAVAGGICNPATGEIFIGSRGTGVTCNRVTARVSRKKDLNHALVLASRSEVNRGEWDRFRDAAFRVRPVGSIAYKLALVAAGIADATWTLVRKHEWDVAAGTALVQAAGGCVWTLPETPIKFNNPEPVLANLVACGPAMRTAIGALLETKLAAPAA